MGQWIEFRTSAAELRDRFTPDAVPARQVTAEQAARNAIYAAFARIVRPPTTDTSLEIRGMQSVAASCGGVEEFDFEVPLSGLHWQSTSKQSNDDMLPPIRQFLRDNGVID